MESKIVKALKMELSPVAILWSDQKPEKALQFKEGKWGCVMWMFVNAVKGKVAIFDRKTYGCWGGGIGLGFGNQYLKFPGGIECFYYFLSIGNKEWETGRNIAEKMKQYVTKEFLENFLEGERYLKSPENVQNFVEQLPIMEIPAEYVILKPLRDVNLDEEKPVVIVFPVTPHQLSALVVLANYGRDSFENVIVPWGAGCQTMGIYAYREAKSGTQRAVIGLTDLSARKYIKKQLGNNLLTFTIPFNMFIEMETNVKGSFLERSVWLNLSENNK